MKDLGLPLRDAFMAGDMPRVEELMPEHRQSPWGKLIRGIIAWRGGKKEKGLALVSEAYLELPRDQDVLRVCARQFAEAGRWKRSLFFYKRQAELFPCEASEIDLALAMLAAGDAEGWKVYEARVPRLAAKQGLDMDLRWDGKICGSLQIVHEGGYGDLFMMLNWIKALDPVRSLWVKDQVTVVCPRSTHGVVRMVFPWVGVSDTVVPGVPWVLAMSLPLFTQPTFRVARFRPLGDSIATGISWRGNPKASRDALRSLPRGEARRLRASASPPWVNLQLGDPDTIEPTLSDSDWLPCAERVMRCARVVTIDSAVAHLAALLGVPSIVLLSTTPDWRWGEATCPYPLATRITQRVPGEWSWVVDRAISHLKELSNASNSPTR